MAQNNNKIEELLSRGVDTIYPSKEALKKVLQSGKRLVIYHGVDPTGPQLHLGHSTNYFTLKRFQQLGHKVIFLIGDFTAQIGDPTDKSATRKPLTHQQVLKNAETYQKQAGKILDFNSKENPIEIKFNSQWLSKLNFEELIKLAANFTVQQMLKREMFQQRLEKEKPIGLHEFLYPLMQGYDSVALAVDVEVEGADQLFNMMVGRTLSEIYLKKEKFVLTTKLLINPTTGKKIMNKSEGSFIGLNDPVQEMYGKIMSLPDENIIPLFELCTEMPIEEIKKISDEMKGEGLNPRDVKARLAKEIVSIYHSPAAAEKAEQEFDKVFKGKEEPTNIKSYVLDSKTYTLTELLVKFKMAPSKSEARRKIEQGGVKTDRRVIKDWRAEIEIKDGMIIQVGKRQFAKLKIK